MIYINISKREVENSILTLYIHLLQKSNATKEVKS